VKPFLSFNETNEQRLWVIRSSPGQLVLNNKLFFLILVFLSQTLRYRNIYVGRPPAPSFGQVGVERRLIPGSTVAKLPVVLACH
jgi:hypothetical protein